MIDESVIVFGGSGFLGSHVADALTRVGYLVRIFDREISPYLQEGQQMIIGDLSDVAQVREAVEGCSAVYNFAGIADIDDAMNRPADVINANILGNMHVLQAAHDAGVERFIFASTIYVFSETGSFYRVSKQSSELFVEAFHERYGLDYTILRYGTLYGRRSDERNSIYRFINEAITENTVTYVGDSNAVREYIHVEDAARLSVQALSSNYKNRHIILTGQEKMSVRHLMEMIAEIMPDDVEIKFSDSRQSGHYVLTPYSFNPSVGCKLVANEHVDIGQGLLDCISDIYAQQQFSEN